MSTQPKDPRTAYPTPPFPEQPQSVPGKEKQMNPKPDHGEESYRGSGKLTDRVALITGADSGIGKAVAIAYAREGADVAISYLNEHEDAKEVGEWVKRAGRKELLLPGDISQEEHCRSLVERTVQQFGRIDILVNNAAFQQTRESLDEISSEEWDHTFRTNIYSMFYLVKAAVPHMQPGSVIISTSSVNADTPKPKLIPYSATKAAIQNFMATLAQLLAEKGIRANTVAPGPIWTPLIPSTMPNEQVKNFGQSVPLKRPGQPVELAPVYVLLASSEASYVSGATVAVTGGQPII
jgi:NAD(P)-dependent dehydrogenase (short-subunit alcohol dehydrogenase family)